MFQLISLCFCNGGVLVKPIRYVLHIIKKSKCTQSPPIKWGDYVQDGNWEIEPDLHGNENFRG
ncbi:MAG: hypothetical protein A2X25_09615 [Chloroflexi bacterium GWB2_49_20]|nr:MAG: hypothetical protein A2X25_09615 [Chloroflexi bacterium GWB2_49_20]OGN79320.1 MAG: hypothetical protein A2X26_04410 [Chloroflexi bacterium GWC2_49_37]OGN82910.1 MAG: hypothetical protein A2X27_08285 [Chloroflexi bacterium GWD2_49_16]HCC78564.1 hypothetical protein [Anaerolineae bacterium]